MAVQNLLRIVLVAVYILSDYAVRSEDKTYVSHSGKDVSTCGDETHPCATLRYALFIRPNISHIYVYSTGGPYLTEVGSEYIEIQHNFTLTGLQGPQSHMAVIQCPAGSNHSKLFRFETPPHEHRIKVHIENLSIRNCQSSADGHPALMEISNALLQIDNSEFSGNGVLLNHSQIAQDNCSSIKLIIYGCVFNNDLDLAGQRLYEPAILLAGCRRITLNIRDSQFQTAPVLVRAGLNTKVNLQNVAFRGIGLRGSSLDITLSQGNNSVTLNQCNVSRHLASRSSPVSISADAPPHQSKISLSSVHFHDNHRVRTRGGALSVFARFSRLIPVQLNVSLSDCSFVNNSVDDLQVAGALYISNVASVIFHSCRFLSNNATEGGAMYLYSAADIQMQLCEFRSNFAINQQVLGYASRGGAVFTMSSQLQMVDTTFSDNSAVYSGSSVFATDATSLAMTRCQLTEPASQDLVRGPANTLLSVYASPPHTSSAVIKLTRCLLQCVVERKHLLMYVSGQTTVSNTTVTCQSNAMTVRQVSQPASQYRAGYELEQIAIWSEMACPTGTYVMNKPAGQSVKSPLGGSAGQHCQDCPDHAFCDGRSVHPDYNYCDVPNSEGHVQILLCPDGYCQPIGGPNATTGCCSEGRSGLMCTGCDSRHTASLQFAGHVTCQPEHSSCIDYSGATVAIICFTLFYVFVLLALMKLCTRQRHRQLSVRADAQPSVVSLDDVRPSTSAESRATSGHVTSTRSLIGCVLALVFFYQLVPSVYPRLMKSSWPLDRAIQLWISLFHLYPAALASGRGFCLEQYPGDQSSVSVQRYFLTMSIYWSQIAVIVLFFAVLAGVFLLTRGPFTEQNIKMLVSFFLPAIIFCQMFSNVPLLRASLQSLQCVAYNGSSVLFTDAVTNCYTLWQIFSIVYVIVCVVPLCLVLDTGAFVLSRGRFTVAEYLVVCLLVPLLGVIWVPINHMRLMSSRGTSPTRDEFEVDETTPEGLRSVSAHSIVTVQSVVIKPFRSYFASPLIDVGWMTVILVRNCVICLLSSSLENYPASRAILVAVVCLGFTVDHIINRGYVEKAANLVDTAALVMLSLLSLGGVYESTMYEAGDSQWTPTVVDWLCRLVVSLPIIIIAILITVLIIRALIRRAKRCRRARPL